MKIMVTSFKWSHACTATLSAPNPQQATTNPHFHWRTPGHSQASLGQSFVRSLLPSPGSWCTGSVCDPQGSISQSCVSSGGSLVGLMVTSFKTAYAIPNSAAARASVPVAVHYWPVPPQEMPKHCSVSVSVSSLGPGAPKICLNLLSISGQNGVWFWMLICSFYCLAVASPFLLDMGYLLTATPAPTILLGFLWPWTWAISSWPLAANSLCYLY